MPAVTGHIEGTGRLDRHGGGSGSGAVMTSYLPSSSTRGCRRHGGSISSPAEAPLFFLRQPTSTRAVHHLTRRMEGHYQPRASVLVRPASPQFYTFNDPGGRGERCASASPGQVGSRGGGARWIGRRDAGEANQKAEGQCRNARPRRFVSTSFDLCVWFLVGMGGGQCGGGGACRAGCSSFFQTGLV